MKTKLLFLLSFPVLLLIADGLKLTAAETTEIKLETNVDFSGVEIFLELTALLENNIKPTQMQWNALFETPGYAVLIQKEFRTQDFFIERFKLAFMPSKEKELNNRLQEGNDFEAQFLVHYVRAKRDRRLIEEAVRELKKQSFVHTAVEEALKFLPEFELKSYPPLSFVIFAPDARGYTPVVLDILFTIDNRDFVNTFLPHEFHHYYRNLFCDFSEGQKVIRIINQIHSEGIADQINVGKWFHNKTLYAEYSQKGRNKSYIEWYEKSPEIIREMDRLFTAMYDFPEQKDKLAAVLKELIPQSGHPTGFFMANLILKKLGKNTLIEDVKNPFAFFRDYKKAADKNGGGTPSFSEKSIQFLLSLENQNIP